MASLKSDWQLADSTPGVEIISNSLKESHCGSEGGGKGGSDGGAGRGQGKLVQTHVLSYEQPAPWQFLSHSVRPRSAHLRDASAHDVASKLLGYLPAMQSSSLLLVRRTHALPSQHWAATEVVPPSFAPGAWVACGSCTQMDSSELPSSKSTPSAGKAIGATGMGGDGGGGGACECGV